jgi:hypothetical protein
MVFEKAEARAKGAKALATWTYSPAHLMARLWQKQWGPEWEKMDGASKRRATFEQRKTEGKIAIKAYVHNKCSI